jgi:hypothetical protein
VLPENLRWRKRAAFIEQGGKILVAGQRHFGRLPVEDQDRGSLQTKTIRPDLCA